ncbi:MAG: hypothetical protein ACXWC2_01490 [Ramlibacter sp.]
MPIGSASTVLTGLHAAAAGGAFVLQSPLALAPAVATCLALAPGGVREAGLRALLFACVAAASGWLPVADAVQAAPAAVLVLLGLATAVGMRLAGGAAWGAIVVGAFASGLGGGMQTASWQEAAGGGLALCLLVVLLDVLLARLALLPVRTGRVVTLGRRMAGAWIGAVGAILLALWLRGGAA